jgi:sensor domain CHASE-containing protein
LIDSAQRTKDHFESWAHPHQEALNQIQPGYFVKVGVTHPELSGERFWGIVKERRGRNFVIQVDQDLIHTAHHGIRDRDVLSVGEENVFGITDSRGNQVWAAK